MLAMFDANNAAATNVAEPDMIVHKSSSVNGQATAGQAFAWLLDLENAGTAQWNIPANGVLVRDVLPTELNYGATTITQYGNPGVNLGKILCAFETYQGDTALTCRLNDSFGGYIAPNGHVVVSITASSPVQGTWTNPAGECAVNPDHVGNETYIENNDCNAAQVVVSPAPPPSNGSATIAKSAVMDAGGAIAYTITVVNNGPQTTATVSDSLDTQGWSVWLPQTTTVSNGQACSMAALMGAGCALTLAAHSTTTIAYTTGGFGNNRCETITFTNTAHAVLAGNVQADPATPGGNVTTSVYPVTNPSCGGQQIRKATIRTIVIGGTSSQELFQYKYYDTLEGANKAGESFTMDFPVQYYFLRQDAPSGFEQIAWTQKPGKDATCPPTETANPNQDPIARIGPGLDDFTLCFYSVKTASTPTGTPTATPTSTPTSTPTGTPSSTPTSTQTPTPTPSPTATITLPEWFPPILEFTPVPTSTPSPTPTATQTTISTSTPSPTATGTVPTATSTQQPQSTASPVSTVAGEKTAGPTPLPPITGSGGGTSTSNLPLALGFGIIALGLLLAAFALPKRA